ncbi:MAG: Ig-like domain-containing protein, partial [Cyanobacteria bacterium P01_G01_bin.4]
SVAENQTNAIDVQSTDDVDSEGAGLTYSISGGADSSLFSIDASTGVVSFNAAPDFESPGDVNGGNDYELQVTVTDSSGLTDVQDITITVTDEVENLAPAAIDDDFSTDEDIVLSGNVLLDNGNGADSDPEGDPLAVTQVNGNTADVNSQIVLTSGALLTLNTDGIFSYDPNGQFDFLPEGDTATDSFTYAISDGNGGTSEATVSIEVAAASNTPPVADDDSFATGFETPLNVPAETGVLDGDTDADGNPLTATLVFGPSNGTLTLNADGSFDYTPDTGFSGTDSFTYVANDGTDDSNEATVSIEVQPVDPPASDAELFISTSGVREDILQVNSDGSLETFFDGSDVGLEGARIDAFDIIDANTILMSFQTKVTIDGLGRVDDSDIVRFNAISLGEDNTAGSFEMEFDASDVGLRRRGDDIDGIVALDDGSLLLSFFGDGKTGDGTSFKKNDLLRFTGTYGADTIGGFSEVFDGSNVDLKRRENVNAAGLTKTGGFYLSTQDQFKVSGLSGEKNDIFEFTANSLGENTTSGSYTPTLVIDGSEVGIDNTITALDTHIGTSPVLGLFP